MKDSSNSPKYYQNIAIVLSTMKILFQNIYFLHISISSIHIEDLCLYDVENSQPYVYNEIVICNWLKGIQPPP